MFITRNDSYKFVDNKLGMIIYQFENSNIKNAIEVNESAAEIIKLANGSTSLEDIIGTIKNLHEIKDKEIINQITEYINYLIQENILRYTDKKQLAKVINGDPNLIIPSQLTIEVTKQCQLKCKHCFNSSGDCMDKEMSSELLIMILEKFSKLGTLQVLLTGGEPLLKENILNIIDYCCHNFFSVTIGTNGIALTDKLIRHFAKYKNLNFNISIDGIESTHDFLRGVPGCYSKSIENIKTLIKYNLPVRISCTLSEYNYREASNIAKYMKSIGCSGINLGYILNKGRARKNSIPTIATKEYLKVMKEVYDKYNDETFDAVNESCDTAQEDSFLERIPFNNKCGAGYRVLSIKADGSVYPCPTCEDIKLGNILSTSILDVLSSDKIEKMLDLNSPCISICGDCEHLPLCKNCISRVLEKDNNCILKKEYYEQKIINN